MTRSHICLMRNVETSSRFRRDYKREKKNPNNRNLDLLLIRVIETLGSDIPLDAKLQDHPLIGDFAGFRGCHIKPDLVLIYKKKGLNHLVLVRLGSHSEVY